MSVRRILDRRGDTVTEFLYDEMTDISTIRRVADVEPVLEANKRLQTQGGDGFSQSRDTRHVASIHPVIYEKWMQEFCQLEGIPFFAKRDDSRWKAFLRKKLNDGENAFLRTSPGSL